MSKLRRIGYYCLLPGASSSRIVLLQLLVSHSCLGRPSYMEDT